MITSICEILHHQINQTSFILCKLFSTINIGLKDHTFFNFNHIVRSIKKIILCFYLSRKQKCKCFEKAGKNFRAQGF